MVACGVVLVVVVLICITIVLPEREVVCEERG